jgi:hypothetical protein
MAWKKINCTAQAKDALVWKINLQALSVAVAVPSTVGTAYWTIKSTFKWCYDCCTSLEISVRSIFPAFRLDFAGSVPWVCLVSLGNWKRFFEI